MTSGVPTGFSVNTNQLPSQTGVACVVDTNTGGRFPDFETAAYTVVDATHITLTLNKAHGSGAVLGVGGMCGYGIEQTADTQGGLRQIFPIVGTVNPTSLYYASSAAPILGNDGNGSTSGFLSISGQISSISRQGNVVTVTLTQNWTQDPTGLTMTVSGVTDPSYNGSFQVTSIGGSQVTYSNTGPNGTSSGGTILYLNGGYVLYPMAEVLSVYDSNTKQVDGQLTLAANTVQWAAGDPVEQPHFYMMLTYPDTEFVNQYIPRPVQDTSAGKTYQGQVGPGMRGWEIQNAVPASNYIGAGGTHQLPDDAYMAVGPWGTDFEVDAGTSSVIRAHCNIHGCNRWNSGYSLFALDSAGGEDFLFYEPNISTMYMSLGGQPGIAFSPNAISVGSLTSTSVATTTMTAGYQGRAQLAAGGSSGYSNFTLNGNNADGQRIGFIGGGGSDENLYLDVPTGGQFDFRVNNVHDITFTGANGGTVLASVVQAQQLTGSGTAPSVSNGAAAGGGSSSISGTTISGVLSVTTGGSPAANGTLATVGWSLPSSTPPAGCALMPRNAAAAAATGTIFTGAPSTSGWTVNVGVTALSASTSYAWSYQCF
jgi:hypothetical protein